MVINIAYDRVFYEIQAQARGRSELPMYCVKHKNSHANNMDVCTKYYASRLHAHVTWKGQEGTV